MKFSSFLIALFFLHLHMAISPDKILADEKQTAKTSVEKRHNGTLHTNLLYGKADGEELLLDAFVPDETDFPIALVVHGGGWCSGDKAGDEAPILAALSKAGWGWFSINYRLAPQHRWPAAAEDVNTALEWVRTHAAEWGGDPQRLVLIGYSAGGHLAVRAALRADKGKVSAVVGFAAPIDMVADIARRGGLSPSMQALLDETELSPAAWEKLRQISPLHDVHPDAPPFLLLHGTEDKSVPYAQSLALKEKLEADGVACDLITLKDAQHRLADWKKYDPAYLDKMTDWLKRIEAKGTPIAQ